MAAKKINFELIPPPVDGEISVPYELMEEMRVRYHSELAQARIALAWRIGFKPDPDGRLILGRCMRATDLQRELVNWDFIILLNREVWNETEFTREKRLALLDHELCHAARAKDKKGNARVDERGRPVWRMRRHDVEEFRGIVERHGTWKGDLERFAEALLKKQDGALFTEPKAEIPQTKEMFQ